MRRAMINKAKFVYGNKSVQICGSPHLPKLQTCFVFPYHLRKKLTEGLEGRFIADEIEKSFNEAGKPPQRRVFLWN